MKLIILAEPRGLEPLAGRLEGDCSSIELWFLIRTFLELSYLSFVVLTKLLVVLGIITVEILFGLFMVGILLFFIRD